MANKNFVVHNGLTVGPLTIDAATGDINTSGNVNITGNLGVSQIAKNDSSVSITDTGSGSSVSINIDGTTEHTVDADGVNLATGDRYAIDGTSVLNATTLGSAVVNSSLTSVGNLTQLSVAGDATVHGNLIVYGLSTLNGGTLTLGDSNTDNVVIGADINSNVRPNTDNTYNLGSSGQKWAEVYATNLTGTIQTASQTNITTVGTLGSLSVTGNVGAGNVSGTYLTGTLTTASQTAITAVGTLGALSVTGNVGAGNVSGTYLTGTLTTASQLNITSVGTLGSLSVTGNVGAGNVSATSLTGTLTTASQPNITSTGNLTAPAITVGNGSAAATINSQGSYNLRLTTGDGLSSPEIKLIASDDGNIELNPSGIGVIKSLAHLYVGDGTSEANIASLGAYDLTLSTNRDLGRAYIKLSSSSNGNIDFGLNGSGTVNIPNITFSDNSYQSTAVVVAGSDTYIQYNTSGDLDASSDFTFDPVTKELAVNGTISIAGALAATVDDATALAIALG